MRPHTAAITRKLVGPLASAYPNMLLRSLPAGRIRTIVAEGASQFLESQTGHSSLREAVLFTGQRIPVDTSEYLERTLYLFGVWEPTITRLLLNSLSDKATFVDVGANIGYYTLIVAALRPDGTILALEPSPSIYRRLVANLERNNVPVEVAINAAATRAPCDRISVYLGPPGNAASTSTITRSGGGHPGPEGYARGLRLCDLIQDNESSIGAIKIDVEGSELDVLQGLQPSLHRLRSANIFIEISPPPGTQRRTYLARLFEMMEGHQSQAWILRNRYWSVEDYVAEAPLTALAEPAGPESLMHYDLADLVFTASELTTLYRPPDRASVGVPRTHL